MIAYEDSGVGPDGSEYFTLRHMSLDEALAHIDVLMRALQFYLEKFKPLTDDKLSAIYNEGGK